MSVVVECSRGASLKLEYNAAWGTLRAVRPLPPGLVYPFDWGFVPGTQAEDGDPVDALVVDEHSSPTGTIVQGNPIGMLDVRERKGRRAPQSNPRILVAPHWSRMRDLGEIDAATLEALRAFLVSAGESAGKQILHARWRGARDALRALRDARIRG